MTTTTRWKLATAILAAVTGYTTLHGHGGAAANRPATTAHVSRVAGGMSTQLRRPLRISAAAAGISKDEIVERMLQARTVKEVTMLAEKLGTVGDDDSVAAVASLLDDTRRGVPESILATYGAIGTEQAVAAIIAHAKDDRPQVRTAAIAALGATQSEAAETLLIDLSKQTADPAQSTAISALGTVASDRAVKQLIDLATAADYQTASSAVYALAQADTATADVALRKLVDAPDSRIAASALQSIDVIDEALFAKLKTILRAGDYQLVNAALTALGKAGEGALPVLKDAAMHGNPNTRWAAVNAIGEIAGPQAVEVLGDLMKTGDRTCAMAAAQALSWMGGSDARGLIIEAALGERAQVTGALTLLANMEGPDVDAALLSVVRDGSSQDRRAALPRLLKTNSPDALALAVQLANKGSRNERYEALRMLADAGTPSSYDALMTLAGSTRGGSRSQALDMLSQVRPGDPALAALLTESLFSGRKGEAVEAATVLGRLGTSDARAALVKALGDKDIKVSTAAAEALGTGALSDEVKASLLAAAAGSPQMKLSVMQNLVQAGSPEGYKLAMEVLDGKDAGAAAGILYALANQGTPEAREVLQHALASKDPSVKQQAISALGSTADDKATDQILALVRDPDDDVRRTALQTLGQIGSDRASAAVLDATRSGKVEDRVAAISSLSNSDDAKASQQLASLMRDQDPKIAAAAVGAAYNGGPEVDQALQSVVNNANADAEVRSSAAYQLRSRGTDVDAATEKVMTGLVGEEQSAGYGGGMGGYGRDYLE